MPTMSEARKRANKKWNEANVKERYDRVSVLVKKGRKIALQAHSKDHGESLNGFINRAIEETLERDQKKLRG